MTSTTKVSLARSYLQQGFDVSNFTIDKFLESPESRISHRKVSKEYL